MLELDRIREMCFVCMNTVGTFCAAFYIYHTLTDGSAGKESACSARETGDMGSIPGSGRSPGEGNCRRAWWATIHGVAKSQTRLSLSMMRMHLDN